MINNNIALVNDLCDSDMIESVVAMFRNFAPEKPVGNAVIYFWESHTENDFIKKRIQSTIDLIYKEFDMSSCEKYEIRTGYLNRYNHLPRSFNKCTLNEINCAAIKGEEEQEAWVSLYAQDLPDFEKKDWKSCILKERNLYYNDCKNLVQEKREHNADFAIAIQKSVEAYADKHSTDKINGELYILEEISWILSLPLLHINKSIYLIHVGNDNPAIKALFHNFPNLQKAVKWLSPHFCNSTFVNISDFLMDYRNASHMGHSYAVENKDAVQSIRYLKKKEHRDRSEPSQSLKQTNIERSLLRSIIEKFPGHVYWLNSKNIYMGCNELQARNFGLKSRDEIIGKTNSDLLASEEAIALDKINKSIIETGQPYEGEELAMMRNKPGNYLSQKVPLRDDNGEIIGVLGVSIDITDRKKAEKLEIKNKLQKIKIDEQEEFKKFTARIVHDITSPLISLEYFAKYCKGLSENYYATLMSIVTSIRNIAGDLLNRYMQDRNEAYSEKEQYILVSLALLELISHKRYQYKESKIKLNYLPDPATKFIFIKGDLSNFGRMISNLINNSVEAYENGSGTVILTTEVENQSFKITIKDNGKGMNQELIHRINGNIPVNTTKAEGHGIGLDQVMSTLELYDGQLFVESKEGEGTAVTISFPIVKQPSWIAEQILIHRDSTVIIVDAELSIHDVWKTLLKDHLKYLNLVFYTNCKEAFAFIASLEDKSNVFLLADLKLKNNSFNELNTILQNDMKERSFIVTNIYNNKITYELVERVGIKILPKQLMSDVPIVVK